MKTGRVYKITSPNNKIYIGSTARTLKERWSDYKRLNCKGQIHLYNSFTKYGVENHKFEIIWEGDLIEMYKQEVFFGKKYNVLGRDTGLNCKLPKELDNYQCFSQDTLKKMSKSAKNRQPMSELTKSKISISSSNMSNENRKIFSERMKGNKYSLGKKASEETKLKMSISKKKSIMQYDLNDNFIKEWDSAMDASKELNLHSSNITACCKNKIKRVKIFKFKYK